MNQTPLTEVTDSAPSDTWGRILSEMHQDLLQKHGLKAVEEFNFEAGTAAARAISDHDLTTCSEELFWRKIEGYMTSLGWGKPELHYAKMKHDGFEIFTVLVNTSMFTQRDPNYGPTCDVIRGGIMAWLDERYGRVTKSEETKCTTKGAAHCIFSFQIGERKQLSPLRRRLSAFLQHIHVEKTRL
jgi:predicted hydrocarbon binding protein